MTLQKMLDFVTNAIPYYRQFRGLPLEDFPFLTKSIIRQNLKALRNKDDKGHQVFTSGSTGQPLEIYHNNGSHLVNQQRQYLLSAGMTDETILFSFFNVPFQKPGQIIEKRSWGFHRILIPILPIDWEATISLIGPHLSQSYALIGYPSILSELAKRADHLRPKVVILAGETYWDHYRQTIEEGFDTNSCTLYGHGERVLLGFNQNGHYDFDHTFGKLELIDGEIVGTTLTNTAMPLIRYRTGDRAVVEDERITFIEGKMTDLLTTENGFISPLPITDIMARCKAIREWQIIQEDLRTFRIKIVGTMEDGPFLRKWFSDFLGVSNINLEVVDGIPTTNAGKRKVFVNHCN